MKASFFCRSQRRHAYINKSEIYNYYTRPGHAITISTLCVKLPRQCSLRRRLLVMVHNIHGVKSTVGYSFTPVAAHRELASIGAHNLIMMHKWAAPSSSSSVFSYSPSHSTQAGERRRRSRRMETFHFLNSKKKKKKKKRMDIKMTIAISKSDQRKKDGFFSSLFIFKCHCFFLLSFVPSP